MILGYWANASKYFETPQTVWHQPSSERLIGSTDKLEGRGETIARGHQTPRVPSFTAMIQPCHENVQLCRQKHISPIQQRTTEPVFDSAAMTRFAQGWGSPEESCEMDVDGALLVCW